MIIGIDASNIKSGGGLTHLINVLSFGDFKSLEINKIIIWSGMRSNKIVSTNTVFYSFQKLLSNGGVINTLFWRLFILPKLSQNVDIVFSPGGITFPLYKRCISMSQNMLVFESKERNRFPFGKTYLRYHLLEFIQYLSLFTSLGNIYISNYAHDYIKNKHPTLKKIPSAIIYHGVSSKFTPTYKNQLNINNYNHTTRYKILYVSTINYYKHQWVLIDALKKLINEGFPIELNLVGGAHPHAFVKIEEKLKEERDWVTYHGEVAHDKINQFYSDADLFVFLSTCENMPNILIEAMASGLPICSSSFGPMPEILGDAGVYFNPTDINSVYTTIKNTILDPENRAHISNLALKRALQFTWQESSFETFKFITSFMKH